MSKSVEGAAGRAPRGDEDDGRDSTRTQNCMECNLDETCFKAI